MNNNGSIPQPDSGAVNSEANGGTAELPLLIGTDETLRLLGGLSRAGYHKARSTGRFAPLAIKIGKKVMHRRGEVVDWANAGCPPATKWNWSMN